MPGPNLLYQFWYELFAAMKQDVVDPRFNPENFPIVPGRTDGRILLHCLQARIVGTEALNELKRMDLKFPSLDRVMQHIALHPDAQTFYPLVVMSDAFVHKTSGERLAAIFTFENNRTYVKVVVLSDHSFLSHVRYFVLVS